MRNPNHFSSYVLFALPLVVQRIADAAHPRARAGYLALLALSVTAIVLTYSRGGALVLVITAAAIAWQHRRRLSLRHLGPALMALVLAGGMVLAWMPASYWERQAAVVEVDRDISIRRRAAYLTVAWDAFLEAPVLGHGPGSFRDIFGASPHAVAASAKSYGGTLRRAAHDTYLDVLVGSGLIGLAAFLALLGRAFANLTRAARLWRDRGDAAMASLSLAFRTSLFSLSVYFLLTSQLWGKYLWIALAVSVVLERLARRAAGKEAP